MATRNFFDLLADDENEDPSQVVVLAKPVTAAAVDAKPADKRKPAAPAKLPTKPAYPSEAVRDVRKSQYDGARGGRGGYRGGRGGRGYNGDREGGGPREGGGYRERGNYNNDRNASITRDADGFVGGRGSYDRPIRTENGEGRSYEGGRGGGRGRGRGGRGFGEGDEYRPRREFDRQSGGSRGGSVRGVSEESKRSDRAGSVEKTEQGAPLDAAIKEGTAEKKEQDVEMTLEEYEKVLEEKRKALEATKASERTVEMDKAFEKMQLVDNKKREEDVFIKLGHDKEKITRDAAEREEKSRKPVSINEFLKPAEGERFYYPSNRGRGGRGDRRDGGDRRDSGYRGDRDSTRGSFGGGRGSAAASAATPKIEDQSQFPTLGGK